MVDLKVFPGGEGGPLSEVREVVAAAVRVGGCVGPRPECELLSQRSSVGVELGASSPQFLSAAAAPLCRLFLSADSREPK